MRVSGLWVTLGILMISACSNKELDFDMIDDLKVKSGATLPLANLSLSIEDLVSDIEDSTLVVDPDNALRIYYREDSVFTYSIDDILTVPDQSPIPLPVDRNQPTVDIEVALGTIAGAQLFDATFETGTVKMELSSNVAPTADTRVAFTIRNAVLNGLVYADTFVLPAGATASVDSALINGLLFDFTNGNTGVNVLDLGLELIDTMNVSSNAVVIGQFSLKDLSVEVATGYFGDRLQSAPPGDFDFNINGLDQFAGGFYLTDPRLTLITRSTVGLPLEISTDFIGENAELNRVSLDNSPFQVQASPAPGVVANSNLVIEPSTSQISEFLANIPQKIYYSGSVQINPQGQPASPNFISNTSNVVVDFEVDVPMEFRLEDMRLDEIAEIGSGINNLENVEELTVYFRSENRLPFDLNLSVSFLTATGDSIDGFELPLLSAAPVDANGRVTAPSIEEIPVVFDEDLINSFLFTQDLRFVARANTTNNGQTAVKLYTDYDLSIKTAMQVKGNYKIGEE